MSASVALTAAFGEAASGPFGPTPGLWRRTRIFADLIIGGTGLYTFAAPDTGHIARLYSDAGISSVLMAGAAIVDPALDAGEVASSLRARVGERLHLSESDAHGLADAVGTAPVAGLITILAPGFATDLDSTIFRDWDIKVARLDP